MSIYLKKYIKGTFGWFGIESGLKMGVKGTEMRVNENVIKFIEILV